MMRRPSMMRRPWTLVLLTCALVGVASDGLTAVLCKRKSGTVVLRDEACRERETGVDLSTLGAQGPLGPEGEQGQPGEPGPRGPSNGYVTSFKDRIDIPEDAFGPIMRLDVPAGSYVVTARLLGVTLPDPDGPVTSNYRYRCMIRIGGNTPIAFHEARVGFGAGIESHLTYLGAGSFPQDTSIRFSCHAANGHPLQAVNGTMTAVRVDELQDQTPEP